MTEKAFLRSICPGHRALVLGFVLTMGLLALVPNSYAKSDFLKGDLPRTWERGKNCNQWNLGPLGAFGFDDTTNFLIREVLPGSPADGKLKQYDVILEVVSPLGWKEKLEAMPGADRKKRNYLLRTLGLAINEAQKRENGGKLVLKVWRPQTEPAPIPKGALSYFWYEKSHIDSWSVRKEPIVAEEIEVELTIPVTGAFSETAPWECEKTRVIIDRLAESVLKRELQGTHMISRSLDALGLLATGEKKYLPAVQAFARDLAKSCEGMRVERVGEEPMGKPATWDLAYRNLFLAEYYLATGDQEVLPGLTDLSTTLAMGRSGVGTYSHGLAATMRWGLYGPANAYGAMNQCSITANMSLALAQKCGIKNEAIDDAVAIATQFLLWFVDAGSIDYGNADAWPFHDDNGKNSQAAVFFDIVGHKRATEYFTRTTLASYMDRVQGHTGHFFNGVWGAMGAARGGPAAAVAFAEKTRWYSTLELRVNGDAFFNGPGKYRQFSTAGAKLLHYCLPRKALYITGKGGSSLEPLSSAEIRESLDAAWFDPYDKEFTHARSLTTEQLLAKLGSFSPVVRRQAAIVLGERANEPVQLKGRELDMVQLLMMGLKSSNRYTRCGAVTALHYAGRESDEAAQALVSIIADENEDLSVRYHAVKAMQVINEEWKRPENGLVIALMKVVPDLLEIVARYQSTGEVSPETYLKDKLNARIATTAFNSTFSKGPPSLTRDELAKLDIGLVKAAAGACLANPLQDAHDWGVSCLRVMDLEDQESLVANVYRVATTPPPAAYGKSRLLATEVLALLQVKEGIPVAEAMLDQETHGRYWRRPLALRVLSHYGPDALGPIMEKFNKYAEIRSNKGPRYERNMVKAAVERLEKKRGTPTQLKSIRSFMEKAGFEHGSVAYCLLAKPGEGDSIKLTWMEGKTMPTSGRVFREGKEIARIDPAKLIYVDQDAPPGKVDYRVEFTLPDRGIYSLETSFPGRPEDLKGELGVLKVVGTTNPTAFRAWQVGDPYRLMFVSSEKTDATSKDLGTYDTFVTDLAKKAGIGGSWRVFTGEVHTRTDPKKDPGNIPVFLIDGKTKIADNYDDLWDSNIDAPINRTETGEVLTEGVVFGGAPPWELGNSKRVGIGYPTAHDRKWRWISSGTKNPRDKLHIYAISDVLHIVEAK